MRETWVGDDDGVSWLAQRGKDSEDPMARPGRYNYLISGGVNDILLAEFFCERFTQPPESSARRVPSGFRAKKCRDGCQSFAWRAVAWIPERHIDEFTRSHRRASGVGTSSIPGISSDSFHVASDESSSAIALYAAIRALVSCRTVGISTVRTAGIEAMLAAAISVAELPAE